MSNVFSAVEIPFAQKQNKLPFNLHKRKTQNITNLNVSDMQPVRHNFSNQYKIGIFQYDEDKCYHILRFFFLHYISVGQNLLNSY